MILKYFIALFLVVTTAEQTNFSTMAVDLWVSLTIKYIIRCVLCVHPIYSVSTISRQQLNTIIPPFKFQEMYR